MYNSINNGGGPGSAPGNINNVMGDLQRYQPLPLQQNMHQVGGGPPGGIQQNAFSQNAFPPPGRRSAPPSSRRQPGPAAVAGALPLDASMQELFGQGVNPFGRRSAGPFPDGMGDILNRRDSMDSTTAVLDACILDLTRRRISMAMGGGPQGNEQNQGGFGGAPTTQGIAGGGGNQAGPRGGSLDPLPHAANAGPTMMGGNMHGHHGAGGGGGHQQNYSASSIAAKQQMLQQQQLELEMQQKKLEMQRQQLFSGMQDFSMQNTAMPPMMGGGGQLANGGMGPAGSMGNAGMGGMGGGGHPMRMPEPTPTSRDHQDRGGMQPQQQWWICQVCNSKAFASRDEAMNHEAICQEGQHQHHVTFQDPPTRPMHQDLQMQQMQRSLSHMQSGPHPNFGMDDPEVLSIESNGPFASLPQALPLAMLSDKDWLTPLHCFVRRHCVQVFCASNSDVQTPSKGKRKPIQVGQVGIRCPHCHSSTSAAGQRERGSVYYPTTISSIYNATMNLLQRHLNSCSAVPTEIMERYTTLKADDARSGTSKKYWVESALSLGLVDTPNGIRFSALRPPPLPHLSRQQRTTTGGATRRNSNDFFSTTSNTVSDISMAKGMDEPLPMHSLPSTDKGIEMLGPGNYLSDTGPLVTVDDKPYATAFSYNLLSQMQPCVFTEADRLGKRKGLPAGFAGLACRHCFGGYGSGRFFPSSIKTLSDTSKTLNVLHNHMMRCRKCPPDVRELLEKLRIHHDDERAKMKFGSQKAFFAKIWARLHDGISTPMAPPSAGMKRKMASYEPPVKMASYEPPMKMASYEPPSKPQVPGFSPAKMQQMMNSVAAQQQQQQSYQQHSQQHQMHQMHHQQQHQHQMHHQQSYLNQNQQHHGGIQQNRMSPPLPSNMAHLQQQMMAGGLDVMSRQTENDNGNNKRQRTHQM